MTQEAALHSYWNSFGIPAYNTLNVPDDAEYPYITYEGASGLFNDLSFPTVNVWYKTHNLASLHEKVREIASELKNGGITLNCDDGMIWLTPGTPWCNYLTDPVDEHIKRAVLNVNVNFITT